MKSLMILGLGMIFTLSLSLFGNNQHTMSDPYTKEWKEIEDLDQKGLPKSALEKVELLISKIKNGEEDQKIKCIIYRNKYMMQLEEYGAEKAILRIEKEVESQSGLTKAVLHSMLGELFHWYGERNQHKLRKRSFVEGDNQDDLATWSFKQIIDRSNQHYAASLEGSYTDIALSNISNILTKSDAVSLTYVSNVSTFLEYRAIEHFSNRTSMLTEPVYAFQLDSENAFADRSTFVQAKFESKDTQSFLLKTIHLYQSLLKGAKDKSSQQYFDVARLRFVHQHSTHPDKDTLFEAGLGRQADAGNVHAVLALSEYYINKGGRYQEKFEDQYKEQLSKAHQLLTANPVEAKDTFLSKQQKHLISRIERKELSFQIESAMIPEKPFLVNVRFKNIDKIFCKVLKIDNDTRRNLNMLNQEERLSLLENLPITKAWSVDLSTSDFNNHATEIRVEGLPLGQYALMISNDEVFKTAKLIQYSSFQVSNLSAWTMSGMNPMITGVTDRWTGNPMSSVEVTYFENKYNHRSRKQTQNKISSGLTNKDGIHEINIDDQRNVTFQCIKGEDAYYSDQGVSNYKYRDNKARSVVHLFTDRNLYRPGQTAYFKGLVLEIDGSGKPTIVKNKEVTVTLKDANYQDVETLTLRSNEYGSVQGHFNTPQGGLNGRMQILAKVQNGNGNTSIRVEEYKRPKFNVEIEKTTTVYQLFDNVVVTGLSKMFSGAPVEGASVKYTVTRKTRYHSWYWRGSNKPSMQIATGNTVTDAGGNFNIEFPLLPDSKSSKASKPIFAFQVDVEVVDITGETHTDSYTLSAGYESFIVGISCADKIDKSKLDSLNVTTKNYSNGEVDAQGKLTIYKLKQPAQPIIEKYWGKVDTNVISEAVYRSDFPNFNYNDSDDKENWEVVNTFEAIDVQGNSKLKFPALDAGSYKLEAVFLVDGSEVKQVKFVEITDANNNVPSMSTHTSIDGLAKTYEPNQNITLAVKGRDKNGALWYVIEKGGKVYAKGWKTLNEEINIPVKESDRGGFVIHTLSNSFNRTYNNSHSIKVPWANKELSITYERLRDKLTPGEDVEWVVNISGKGKDKFQAEYLTTMYDASLDALGSEHTWKRRFYPAYYSKLRLMPVGYGSIYSNALSQNVSQSNMPGSLTLPQLNWFSLNEHLGYYPSYAGGGRIMRRGKVAMMSKSAGIQEESMMLMGDSSGASGPSGPSGGTHDSQVNDQSNVQANDTDESSQEGITAKKQELQVRENLDELVFFYPNMQTDKEGNIQLKFKMNEALTQWKIMSFAHTADLEYAFDEQLVETTKELMIYPNMPRFLRNGDAMTLNAKVINLGDKACSGNAKLDLVALDKLRSINEEFNVNALDTNFTLEPGESKEVTWTVQVPKSYLGVVEYTMMAIAGDFSDGEKSILPVVTNRKLVTETMPIYVRGNESKSLHFTALDKMDNGTIVNHNFALEFTSHPMWYAVQALPYIAEDKTSCTEQIFNRYYANVLASHIANSSPKIKGVFEQWRQFEPDALQSALEKNQNLKSAVLKETPWVRQAQSESTQKKNIALLFDENNLKSGLASSIQKLMKAQTSNGGFSWFLGGRDDWYITQYVLEGLGHLYKLGAIDKSNLGKLNYNIERAQHYVNKRLIEHYEKAQQKGREASLNSLVLHYLYTKSLFENWQSHADNEKIEAHYISLLKEKWLSYSLYEQGMCALILHRRGDKQAVEILASFKERALQSDELGMYWKEGNGYHWHQLPIERHALMIEVFDEVSQDATMVDELKLWLLKNKQTNHWPTTKSTSAAIYALLLGGSDTHSMSSSWLAETEPVDITLGSESIQSDKAQAGTGYIKISKGKNEITKDLAQIEVHNPNQNVAWGAVYYQYFEDLDQINYDDTTPLKVKKDLYIEQKTDTGTKLQAVSGGEIHPGDKVIVRIEIRVDRAMEYVHMKDMRSSGLEPIHVKSGYRWKDGLGYYESTEDLASHFYFSRLSKGTYVFEYPLRAVHRGTFSNGITTLQSMYAPEFSSHSKGETIEVK